jgi:hypothetical protein
MVREAGFPLAWISDSDRGVIRWKDIKAFEALVRADEREACYTIAKFNQSNHLEHLTADQIKARGKTK